jgi:cytochrome c oxidase assembly factor CtaG
MRSTYLRISWSLLATLSLTLGLIVSGGAYKSISPLPDAGMFVSWSNQVLTLGSVLIGLVIVGMLTVHTFLASDSKSELSSAGKKALKTVARLSLIWALLYVATAITTLANVLGLNLKETFAPGVLQTYIFDFAPSRTLIISSILAIVVALGSRFALSLNSSAGLFVIAIAAVAYPILNSHSAALGNHSLAITASVAHGISMSIWVGTVLALYPFIQNGNTAVVNRFSVLASACVVALVLSGVVAAATRMQSFSDLISTGYGYLVLAKCILFTLIAYCATRARSALARAQRAGAFVFWELVTMALATGVGVALHFTPPTRLATPGNSAAEDILGFNFPPAPSAANYIFGWYPDWLILLVALGAASLYVIGLARLRQTKISWPALRSISFFSGISILIWVTNAGIAKYAMISFSAHMIQHMVLAMIVPIFIVLGAPITLALRALPAGTNEDHRNARAWITAVLHSRYSQIVTNPLLVLFIFTVSLYGIYFTSAFASLMSSHVGHIAMELHFLITGILFSFLVIGIDPAPRRLPHWAKLILVLVALSVHAFFALAIMQSTTPIGDAWYAQVQPPWLVNQLDATYTGGGIAWAIGELPTLMLLIIVAVQWARDDARTARQVDRAADRDDDAVRKEYNDRLAKMNNQQD